jgi:aspartyl protease family protein
VEIPEGKLGIELKKQGGVYLIKGNITRDGYNHTYDFVFDTGAALVSVPFSVVKLLYQQKIVTDADFNEKISLQTASGDVVSGMTFNIKELELKTTDGKSVRLFNVEAVVKTDQIILESLDLAAEPPILLGQSALSKLKKFELDYDQNLLLINNP